MSILMPKNLVPGKHELVYLSIVSLTLILFSTKNYFHFPYALMSVLGCFMLYRDTLKRDIWNYKIFFILFFSIWIPMVVATILSSSFERSFEKTISYLLFLPSTYFLLKVSMKNNVGKFLSYVTLIFFIFLLFDSIIYSSIRAHTTHTSQVFSQYPRLAALSHS